MELDMNAIAAKLYPTMTQAAPAVPPVEATATTEPATTKPAEPKAVEADTHTTTDQTTDHTTEGPYTLALPKDSVLEARAVERITAFAKANDLSPEAAQQALEHANGEVAAYRDQQTNDWNTLTRETWVAESKADPEIGGEKFAGAVTDAKRFLEKFGDDDIRQFLDETGFGNNKCVIRLLARAEQGRTNPRRLTGGPEGAVAHKTVAQKTYPYMNP